MKLLIGVLTLVVVAFPTYLLIRHTADQHSHAPARCGERTPLEQAGNA
jgi:hypothetical protein